MKISYKCDYALKTVLELALSYQKGLVTIQDLSEKLDIPQKFLEQILLLLKKGEFAKSNRGKSGGYSLAKNPAQISVGDVVRFVEGPLEPIACVNRTYKGCKEIHSCVFQGIWVKTTDAIADIVDNITFEELVNETSRRNFIFDFSI